MKDLGFSNTPIFTGNKDHGFVNTICTDRCHHSYWSKKHTLGLEHATLLAGVKDYHLYLLESRTTICTYWSQRPPSVLTGVKDQCLYFWSQRTLSVLFGVKDQRQQSILTGVKDLGLVDTTKALLLHGGIGHLKLLHHSVVELEPLALVGVGQHRASAAT